MTTTESLITSLDRRRSRLGMSKTDLAARARVPLQTLHRLLRGGSRPSLNVVAALASALGVEVRLGDTPSVHESVDVTTFRARQARSKAQRLAKLVQGTMALEAEAVDASVMHELENENMLALLTGSSRRLWGE